MLNYVVYCDALLNNRQTNRLQRAQISDARLVNRVRRQKHVTPILPSMHWLPIRMRITITTCTYILKILHGLAPDYLNSAIVRKVPKCDLATATNVTFLVVTVSTRTIGFAVTWPQRQLTISCVYASTLLGSDHRLLVAKIDLSKCSSSVWNR